MAAHGIQMQGSVIIQISERPAQSASVRLGILKTGVVESVMVSSAGTLNKTLIGGLLRIAAGQSMGRILTAFDW